MYRPLTEPIEAWHFNMRCPPEESGRKSLDLSFTADGIFNAVLFWYTLQLTPDIAISSAPMLSNGSSGVYHCKRSLSGTTAYDHNFHVIPCDSISSVLFCEPL